MKYYKRHKVHPFVCHGLLCLFLPLLCNNSMVLFCLLCLKVCAQRIITIAWQDEAPTMCRVCFVETHHIHLFMLNTLYCVKTIWAKLSRHWKLATAAEVLVSFQSDGGDYLQREHGLGHRFGRRSGRGRSTGFHPWHCLWMGRLLSPLNKRHNKHFTVIRTNTVRNYLWKLSEQTSFCLTYLQRSETWRACPKLKPCTVSFLLNS